MSTLDDAIKQWRLPELLTAWLAYQMPEYNDGLPYWNNLELAKIGRGLKVANSRIVELETEIRRLRVRLAIANISPDANLQEIRDRQRERENKWFHKEKQVKNLKADNAELRATVRALTGELNSLNQTTTETYNSLWALLYPDEPESWEYPAQIVRHLQAAINDAFDSGRDVEKRITAADMGLPEIDY